MGRRRSSTGSDCSEPFWGLFGNGKDLDKVRECGSSSASDNADVIILSVLLLSGACGQGGLYAPIYRAPRTVINLDDALTRIWTHSAALAWWCRWQATRLLCIQSSVCLFYSTALHLHRPLRSLCNLVLRAALASARRVCQRAVGGGGP